MDDSYKLKKLIKDLEGRRGRHTELISLYIPKDYSLNEINNLLSSEISLTENVKSKQVRNNVTDALNKISQQLKLYKKTPPNGLAIFCGNVSEQEGKTDVKIWVVEPPQAINIKLYWCDQTFELAHLRDMVKEKEVYGLLIMDTKEATFGFLQGKSIKVLRRLDSIVPGKVGKGGQCHPLNTNVTMFNGDIQQIGNLDANSIVKSADFDSMFITDSPVLDLYRTRKSLCYKIITKYPRLEIESSKDHFFFVLKDGEIIEKPAEELKVGDILLMPEKINVSSENSEHVDKEIAQILGYFIGDGNYDKNRLV
ncbi:MAG: hypothetical protein KKI14_03170, partial [Nanoarchaeota archaeon]|nr:hypothetical protein [Nanoarchaeota archaeon]